MFVHDASYVIYKRIAFERKLTRCILVAAGWLRRCMTRVVCHFLVYVGGPRVRSDCQFGYHKQVHDSVSDTILLIRVHRHNDNFSRKLSISFSFFHQVEKRLEWRKPFYHCSTRNVYRKSLHSVVKNIVYKNEMKIVTWMLFLLLKFLLLRL